MTATPPSDSDPPADAGALALDLLTQLEDLDFQPSAVDAAVRALAEHRRRLTLAVVRDHDEAIALPDVADEVAVRETGRALPEVSPETVAEVYISIYHDHLPRLVDVGLLAYDQERDLVTPAF